MEDHRLLRGGVLERAGYPLKAVDSEKHRFLDGNRREQRAEGFVDVFAQKDSLVEVRSEIFYFYAETQDNFASFLLTLQVLYGHRRRVSSSESLSFAAEENGDENF